MKSTTPFPHDRSYDYDADHVNGEIFDGADDLAKVGRVAPRAPLGEVELEEPCNVAMSAAEWA